MVDDPSTIGLGRDWERIGKFNDGYGGRHRKQLLDIVIRLNSGVDDSMICIAPFMNRRG